MKKLAIISTHPIQYNAPWFRMLSERNPGRVKVFYTRSEFAEAVADKEFGRSVVWDVPLTEGYEFQWCENTAKVRSGSFRQVVNLSLISSIEAWGAEAVLIFGWNYQSHLQALRHFKGKIPVLFRGDSTLLDEQPGAKSFLRHLWLRYVYSHVDTALFVGENNHDYFRKCGLHEWQLEFAPHAIDNRRFGDDAKDDVAASAELWRKQLGYGSGDIVLLYCGKFSVCKNILLLLQSFMQWHGGYPKNPLKLLLVGNGELEADLKKLAADCVAVQFLPFQNQSVMPQLYRVGDLFLLPSMSETWGLGVNEAMAAGRVAAVSNRVGCARDLVREGENGFVVPCDRLDAIFEAVSSRTRQELLRLGGNAKRSIQPWSFENICVSIENVLNHKLGF